VPVDTLLLLELKFTLLLLDGLLLELGATELLNCWLLELGTAELLDERLLELRATELLNCWLLEQLIKAKDELLGVVLELLIKSEDEESADLYSCSFSFDEFEQETARNAKNARKRKIFFILPLHPKFRV
jgi:hypothetical protein